MLVASKRDEWDRDGNRGRVHDLDEAVSLRAALALCAEPVKEEQASVAENQRAEARAWTRLYLESFRTLAKFTGCLKNYPLNKWPAEGKAKLRGDLEPLARELWPERWKG